MSDDLRIDFEFLGIVNILKRVKDFVELFLLSSPKFLDSVLGHKAIDFLIDFSLDSIYFITRDSHSL